MNRDEIQESARVRAVKVLDDQISGPVAIIVIDKMVDFAAADALRLKVAETAVATLRMAIEIG